MSRLKKHDEKLWDDYQSAVSYNTEEEIRATINKFRSLPVRDISDPTKAGYDALLLVPVNYDNVNPAKVARHNPFSINVDEEYKKFIHLLTRAYALRFGKR